MSKYIKRITAQNFKGLSFDEQLEPLTIITGGNFKGKTARMDAIRLAMLGNVPEIGKKNDATFELSSGIRMAVSVTFNTGETMAREFWRDGDSIRSAGPKETLNIPSLNAVEYFEMTETQRMDYIASRLELKGATKAGDIVNELSDKLKDSPPEVRHSITSWVSLELHGTPIADALTEMLDRKKGGLAGSFTKWNGIKTNSIGAVRTLADLRNKESTCSAETLESLREVVTSRQAAVEAAVKRQGELAQQAMRANQDRERKAALERRINHSEPAKIPMPEPPISTIDGREPAEDIAALKRTLADHEKKIDEFPPYEIQTLTAQWHEQNAIKAKLEAEVGQRTEALEENAQALAELEGHEACPYCKSKAKGWRSRVKAILEEERKELIGAKNTVAVNLHRHMEGMVLLQNKLTVEQERDRERTSMETIRLGLVKEIERKERMLAKYEQDKEKAVALNESAKREHAASIQSAKEALANLQVAEVDDRLLTVAADNVNETKVRLGEAQADLDAALQLQQDLKRAVQAEEEHQRACAYVEAINRTRDVLQVHQEQNISNVFDVLLESANFYTNGILLSPLAFHQGEVCRFVNGLPVFHRTFSGTEKAVTYMAISAALSEKASPRIVLIDEFGRLDVENKEKVLDKLWLAKKEGRIDQAIIIDVTAPAVRLDGVRIDGYKHIAL